jgi:hypothetical protein
MTARHAHAALGPAAADDNASPARAGPEKWRHCGGAHQRPIRRRPAIEGEVRRHDHPEAETIPDVRRAGGSIVRHPRGRCRVALLREIALKCRKSVGRVRWPDQEERATALNLSVGHINICSNDLRPAVRRHCHQTSRTIYRLILSRRTCGKPIGRGGSGVRAGPLVSALRRSAWREVVGSARMRAEFARRRVRRVFPSRRSLSGHRVAAVPAPGSGTHD